MTETLGLEVAAIPDRMPRFLLGIPVLLLAAAALLFSGQQSLWVDETTQLSGLTMGPIDVVSWLTGATENPFLVPADCSPPVSYWVGKIWVSIFGLSEGSVRLMALFVMILATLVVIQAARRAFGTRAGFFAGCLFALSPNVVEQAVNIRPYPLFMLFSAIAVWSMVRICTEPQKTVRWYALMVLALLLACYTHFFGVVLAGSTLGALMLLVWLRKLSAKPLVLSSLVFLVLVLGLVPFLNASFSVLGASATVQDTNPLRSVIRLVYRAFSHPAISVSHVAQASLGLGLAGIWIVIWVRRKSVPLPMLAILLSLGLGFAAAVTGMILVSGLMTEPKYSLWIHPYLAVGLAATMAPGFRGRSHLRGSLPWICLVLLAFLYGDYQLARNGRWFSHVRTQEVSQIIDRLGPSHVNVIYEDNGGPYGHLMFSLLYTYGSKLSQYTAEGDLEPRGRARSCATGMILPWSAVLEKPFVLVVAVTTQSSKQIVHQLRLGSAEGASAEAVGQRVLLQGWPRVEKRSLVAFSRVDLSLYRRD